MGPLPLKLVCSHDNRVVMTSSPLLCVLADSLKATQLYLSSLLQTFNLHLWDGIMLYNTHIVNQWQANIKEFRLFKPLKTISFNLLAIHLYITIKDLPSHEYLCSNFSISLFLGCIESRKSTLQSWGRLLYVAATLKSAVRAKNTDQRTNIPWGMQCLFMTRMESKSRCSWAFRKVRQHRTCQNGLLHIIWYHFRASLKFCKT